MSDETYGRKNVTWSSAAGSPAAHFDPSRVHIEGATIFTEDGLVAAFRADESGELVQVDLSEAVVGVALSPDGGRWLMADENDESPAQPSEED